MKSVKESAAWHTVFFTIIVSFLLIFNVPWAAADFGDEDEYLGQVVDDYENDDNIAAMINTINNETLGCMELEYIPPIMENFTTYTEVDIGANHITLSDPRVTWIGQTRNEDTRAWKDYTTDYFGDFKFEFIMEYNDVEAGDASSQAMGLPISLSNSNGDFNAIWASSSVMVYASQNGTVDDSIIYYVVSRSGGGTDGLDNSVALALAKYYCTFSRVGAVLTCDFFSDSARTVLVFQLTCACNEDTLRYLQVAVSRNAVADPDDHSSGYVEDLFFCPKIVYQDGHYYTVEMLEGDPAIAILYNLTIPAGCGATMEFSTDNVTWVDHNNQAGSDTLIAGYEALDLRDIYNGTLYRHVNMTSDGEDTPRMWQARFVTVTDQPSEGWVLTVMIAAIGGTLVILGTRRRR